MRSQLIYLLLAFTFCSPAILGQEGAVAYNEESIDNIFVKVYQLKHNARFDEAVKQLQTAVNIASAIDSDKKAAACYHIFAAINIDRENYDEAVEYLLVAENLHRKMKDYEGLAISLLDKAVAQSYVENPKLAMQDANEASNLIDRYEFTHLESRRKMTLGILLLKQGNFPKAVTLLKEALPFKDNYESNYLRAKNMLLLAMASLRLNNLDQANNYALEASNIAKTFDFPLINIEAYYLLSQISEQLGDYKTGIGYLKRHYTLENSIFSKERIASEKEAMDNLDNDFKDRIIGNLEHSNADKDQTVKTAKLTSILSSALLIIISLLTISLYRNNQIKIKTNQLLVKKNNELQLAKDKAEKAMNAKAQFLSTVSHELRTPLYAVTGLTHLLLEENPSEHQKEHLKSLKFSGEYLLAFINDILQINKIEAKKLSVKRDDFNLEKILNDVVSSLSTTAAENGNKIHLEFNKNIPPFIIGDPLKLSQIFINLVGNALKFTEKGDVSIIVNVIGQDTSNINLNFKVKDNGIGISKEMQTKIFESFAQGSVQINRKYGGTGLGLTIVRSLLQLLDSDISLQSELGKGSVFSFDISFAKSSKVKDTVQLPQIPSSENSLKGQHVLLVEDNKINQVITKKMIEKKGMTCDIAGDGYKAIDFAMEKEYDVILMDIHMPGISGLQATEEIRKFNHKIPIVALTAISLDENTDDFYKAGCNDVITKPFKPDVFYKKISVAIAKSLQTT